MNVGHQMVSTDSGESTYLMRSFQVTCIRYVLGEKRAWTKCDVAWYLRWRSMSGVESCSRQRRSMTFIRASCKAGHS